MKSFRIMGTDTADLAPQGFIGEFLESTVLAGSAVSLTSPNAANVTSISLTPGDWDVEGHVFFAPAATTNLTIWRGSISTTSATHATTTYLQVLVAGQVPVANFGQPVGQLRLSLAATTTVYLVASATFTVSTLGAYGHIGARRVR